MKRRPTRIEQLAQRAVNDIGTQGPYFTVEDVVKAVYQNPGVRNVIREIERVAPGWNLGAEIDRRIKGAIAAALQVRDENGIRVYGCYSAGQGPRRWLRLRGVKLDVLRAVISGTIRIARPVIRKAEFYELFVDEMARLGVDTLSDDVYAIVAPIIRRMRAS